MEVNTEAQQIALDAVKEHINNVIASLIEKREALEALGKQDSDEFMVLMLGLDSLVKIIRDLIDPVQDIYRELDACALAFAPGDLAKLNENIQSDLIAGFTQGL